MARHRRIKRCMEATPHLHLHQACGRGGTVRGRTSRKVLTVPCGVLPSCLPPVTAAALWPPSVSLRDHGRIGWYPYEALIGVPKSGC
jgi:hypothetical protein